MDSCQKNFFSPATYASQTIGHWRNDVRFDSCSYTALKRAVYLPAGLVLSAALLVESAVKSVFLVLALPLAFFDATKDFYIHELKNTAIALCMAPMLVVFSFSQIFTRQILPDCSCSG